MLKYRRATITDIESIVMLVESAYRGESSRQGWTTEADFIDGQRTDYEEVSELMNRADAVFLLCEDESQLLASVQLNKSKNRAYLGMFAVDPQEQGKGLGKELLTKAEQFAKQRWDVDVIRMLVISIRSELIDWYLRQGYVKTGLTKPFPYEEPRFGIPNRNDLMLEILEKPFV